jgi:hypothetical protein
MQYKAIAAPLGAASVLAMGILAAAEESAKRSYTIDRAGTTVTPGAHPTTMTSESATPVVTVTPPCGVMSQCSY